MYVFVKFKIRQWKVKVIQSAEVVPEGIKTCINFIKRGNIGPIKLAKGVYKISHIIKVKNTGLFSGGYITFFWADKGMVKKFIK
jgi:hypothetical protein